jgi:stage III sporulation protein AA
METVFHILPSAVSRMVRTLPTSVLAHLEEIRIREKRPLEVIFQGTYRFLSSRGGLTADWNEAYCPSHEDCLQLIDLLTNHSRYTLEEELKQGFITIQGGHRVGISGKTAVENGKVKHMLEITGFNIRVAREVKNASVPLMPFLTDREAENIHHTLIVSPPGMGKTTVIRDLARKISYGEWPKPLNWPGKKVGIVDERSELAACLKGVPSFDVGPRTDVLDRCPKAEGMMMLIRSMSPDVIIVDEIGRQEDAAAVREAQHAGVRVAATAHGRSFADVSGRPILGQLLRDGIFSRIVMLDRKESHVIFSEICDSRGKRITVPEVKGAGAAACLS